MKGHNHTVDQLANVNGIVTGLALYPQLIRALITGRVQDLSSLAFGLILINSIIWVVYAVHRRIRPLVVSSFLNIIASGAIIALILKVF
jgi:uncharacterized protein with PQ loop repeat